LNANTTVPTSGLVTALSECKGINGTSSGPTSAPKAAGTSTGSAAATTGAGKSGGGKVGVGFGGLGVALVFAAGLLG
jgi:hypothetical protein